ncbi:MAG: AI-2E family transporter [Bacilli bacterium]|nr:AI-2E family transporter [Mycoplasmatota bacterium]MDY4237097.1 AI-2E family transporter [Bacilli bacterium]
MNNNKKEELNYHNLNEVIGLSKKMLKILYTCVILAIIVFVIILFKNLEIFKVLGSILGVISPFFIGLVIAWLLDPAVTYLQKKNVKRSIGTIVVFFVFILILYLLFRIMLPLLYTQLNEFITNSLPTLIKSTGTFIENLFTKLEATGFDFTSVETSVYKALENIGVDLTTGLPKAALNVVSTLVSSIGTFGLGLIVGFYLLIDFEGVKKIFNYIPIKNKEGFNYIIGKLNIAFRSFVQGTLFISLIIMILSSIFYGIIGLPSALLFGLICGITNIIPYIGPWIGGAICVIVGLTVSPLTGILAGVVAFAIQQVDGMILQPLIMSKTMKLHPVTIMIGLLVFGYLFGILGMIFATPIMASIKIIASYYNEKYNLIGKLKEKTKE